MDSIHLRDARISYRSGFTLGPISLDLAVGCTCLVGANGAGKTTLIEGLAGYRRLTSGTSSAHGERVGYLPQSPHLPPRATPRQLATFSHWLARMPAGQRDSAVSEAMSRLDLDESADRPMKTLSGGTARRAALAATMATDPPILLLDEPTVGLDPVQRVTMRESVRELTKDRIALVSTHLVEDVRGLADRVIVLADGAVAFDGSVSELAEQDDPRAAGDTPLERAMTRLILLRSAR